MTFRRRTHQVARAAATAFGLSLGGAVAGVASPDPLDMPATHGVIELFTSQGCPKCPPADRLIADFARMPGTIALSFAVGTWDYIGWKDTLASPVFSARQRAYAAARGDGLVYTPQAIIDGIGVEAGADRSAILKDIDLLPARQKAMGVPMSVSESGGRIHVAIGAAAGGAPPGAAGVYVLRVAHAKTVEIDRGENSGRKVTYTNVVRAMTRLGAWTGAAEHFDILDLKGDGEGYVILVQTGTPDKPGPILAAAKTADL